MPPRVCVCLGKGLAPTSAWQLSGTPSVGLCMWTPQLPLSLLTLPPSALGTPTGSFGSSAPLPLVPGPDLAPVCFAHLGMLSLTPKFPHRFLSSSLSSCSLGSHQGYRIATVRGIWFLFIFFRVEWCCELLFVLLSLLSFQDVLPAPDNLPHPRAFSCPLSYRGPQR